MYHLKQRCYISFYKYWMCPAFLYNFKSYKVIISGFFTIFIVIIFLIAFDKVGGVEALWNEFGKVTVPVVTNMTSNNTMGNMSTHSNTTSSCYSMTPYWSNMFRPASDPEYPWVGLWIALPIIGIWYWCTDQVSM